MLDRLFLILDQVPWWAFWIGLIFFLLYVVAPLVVWQTQRFSVDRTLDIIDPQEIPSAIDRYFLQVTPGMVAQGFVVVAYLKDARMLAGMCAYLTVWINRACGQAALVGAIVSRAGISPKATWIEFQTELADGSQVETGNNANLGIFLPAPKTHRFQFPGVEDPAKLYQLHLWHEEQKLDPHAPRFLPADEVVVDHIADESRHTMERQVAAGRMNLINGRYQNTLRDAFRITWMQCPPILQIRKVMARIRGKRMMREALARGPRRPLPVITTDVQLVGSSD
jgi:hypothetical protein